MASDPNSLHQAEVFNSTCVEFKVTFKVFMISHTFLYLLIIEELELLLFRAEQKIE